MSIEEIIRAWKSSEGYDESILPASPVGSELSDEELKEVTGGMPCAVSCADNNTCMRYLSCIGNSSVA
ncbi:hypothetical protein KSC_107140 [Ktedonobacter sp. SOSP1-52]|uniref:mersacidin/lichenicidin family type 2 lantibiotic n=1 Tax=Ktedonobacter sp. SOSP1-52 TaxID=2778366 RepID=UPI0019158B16|nr:mersacidin/lichenicidin family type 2 lantibiotic [Ktedonobacter sp. SOSP1-52]GHO71822.1 hypothetical protein KSC_107140 [Ktedonobacter sp. SOSP1-52]